MQGSTRTPERNPSPTQMSGTYSDDLEFDVDMDNSPLHLEIPQGYDESVNYTMMFDESDTTCLEASAIQLAIGQMAEDLEIFLDEDMNSESSANDLEERDMSHLGELISVIP